MAERVPVQRPDRAVVIMGFLHCADVGVVVSQPEDDRAVVPTAREQVLVDRMPRQAGDGVAVAAEDCEETTAAKESARARARARVGKLALQYRRF